MARQRTVFVSCGQLTEPVKSLRREGVMEIAVVNPIEFDRAGEVLADVERWLGSHEFEVHPIAARREELFRSRLDRTDEDQQLVLELIAAHCTEPGDFAQYHSV